MCCGGSEREEARPARAVFLPPALTLPPPPGTKIEIVFTGIGSCVVAGSHSGEAYYFSSEEPQLAIDAEDAPELLSSGFFHLAIRA
jgi:hypothetical protein